MSHHEIKKPEDITIPPSSFFAKLPMLGGILAVAGLGATLGAAFGEHKARAMFSYLFAFEAVLALGMGALGWLLIDHSVRSGWAVVIRRFIETIAGSLPVFALSQDLGRRLGGENGPRRAAAADQAAPKLPDGKVDLSGVWTGGGDGDIARLLKPGELDTIMQPSMTMSLPQSVVSQISMDWNGVCSACSFCFTRKPMDEPA